MTVKGFLKLRGKYVGVDPAHPSVIYADRTAKGAWETFIFEQLADKRFSAKLEVAGTFLTIDDLGNLRASAAVNSWESHCMITPPSEYKDTPSQLYQPGHGVVLDVEVQP